MVRSSGSRLDPSISKVCHVKIQALITDQLIPKRWREFVSNHIEYKLPQDEGDESNPIKFREYLADMT